MPPEPIADFETCKTVVLADRRFPRAVALPGRPFWRVAILVALTAALLWVRA
jgi:hypothetical protein